jgi:hypothetical protein
MDIIEMPDHVSIVRLKLKKEIFARAVTSSTLMTSLAHDQNKSGTPALPHSSETI